MIDIKDRIRSVMSAVFEIDSTTIADDAGPKSIEKWDSLRHMKLVLALEEEFGVRFEDDMIEQLLNLKLIELTLNEGSRKT